MNADDRARFDRLESKIDAGFAADVAAHSGLQIALAPGAALEAQITATGRSIRWLVGVGAGVATITTGLVYAVIKLHELGYL